MVNEILPGVRKVFTLAHELGHHFLHNNNGRQFVDTKNTMSEVRSNPKEETEANSFAAELLVPTYVLRRMLYDMFPLFRIAKSTGASKECVFWRIVNYLRGAFDTPREIAIAVATDYRQRSDDGTIKNASVYDIIRRKSSARLYARELVSIYTITKYVTVCSNGSLFWYQGKKQYNRKVTMMPVPIDKVTLNENGRFNICPRCSNTLFSDDAKYCKMCGLHLYSNYLNKQSGWNEDCGRINVADARFCEYCGTKTYLANEKLLVPWQQLVKASNSEYEENSFVEDEGAVTINPDDLPF